MQSRIRELEQDRKVLLGALRDAVKLLDEALAGTKSGWTREDSKKLEVIRLYSLGV